jgi:hypothetical protein
MMISGLPLNLHYNPRQKDFRFFKDQISSPQFKIFRGSEMKKSNTITGIYLHIST